MLVSAEGPGLAAPEHRYPETRIGPFDFSEATGTDVIDYASGSSHRASIDSCCELAADLGLYSQPDPIGATSNQGGLRLFPARQVGPVAVPSPGGNLFSYAEGNPTRLIDPTGEQAIAWALPAAGGCAIADGPLPVGDVIGAILLAGAIVYDASRERTCEGECSERDARCDRQLKDDEQRCTGWWKMRRNPNYGNYHACMGSAMFRYSECLRFGFPISPLSPTPFQR